MSEQPMPRWHPTPWEQAVCEQIEDGCPHDAEFMASLPWPNEEISERRGR